MNIKNGHILVVLVLLEVLTISAWLFGSVILDIQQYLALLLVVILGLTYCIWDSIFLFILIISLFISMFGVFLFTPFNLALAFGNVNIEIINLALFLIALLRKKMDIFRWRAAGTDLAD